MIKANFIQVSLTNHMLQLVSSDLAAPHKRDTWSQKSPSNTHFGIVFNPEVCRNIGSITSEKDWADLFLENSGGSKQTCPEVFC